jgi:TolB-like protein/DNA-binding winged helix-turn-helix (wHTH) protein
VRESIETLQILRFGVFEVDGRAHELRKQGLRIRLQDQPFQILRFLVEHAGDVVTRDELRQKLWPSSVYVDFDHGLNNAIARVRDALGDAAGTPRFIETLPRIGYRFICPVERAASAAHPINKAADIPIPPADAPPSWSSKRPRAFTFGIVALLVALALLVSLWLTRQRADETRTASLPQAPSIAVLPFASLSSDKDNDYFSDGLTEELVTKLAGIRGLKVVARTSSFRFRGKEESVAAIARALQVNHLLEGSVRRSGTHLRITAQLIDAGKDEHVWSQTFDREAGDIFQIQEEIAFAVAAALKVSLLDPEQSRIRKHGTSDPEAYRLYLIAQAHLLSRAQPTDLGLAKRALDEAIVRDPNFAAAYAGLAHYYFQRAWGTLTDTEEGARRGRAAAERAVALDPASSEALEARANSQFWSYRFGGDYGAYVAAQNDMTRAIELDPSNSGAFDDFGRAILWSDPDRALIMLEQSIRIDLLCTGPNIMIAVILGSRGQLEAGRKRCEDLLKRYPDAAPCRMAIATLDTYFGNFEPAVALMRVSQQSIGGAARILLWSVHMSMSDRNGAGQWLDFGPNPFEKSLSDAARFAMDGHYEQAFTVLDAHRKEYPLSHLLDFPTAKFALIAGRPQQAREILEQRLPDLVRGIEPISARNLLPAMDLATAQLNTGASHDARVLLGRISAYLDGPSALRLPLFTFERARVHALAGEPDAALRALDRAYNEGLRTTWALDLRPQSFLYIDPLDADPAFGALLDDPRFISWRERIREDNARQLERLRVHATVRSPT